MLEKRFHIFVLHALFFIDSFSYNVPLDTPIANMADHSVGARDESHESEVSQALMVCFDNDSPEKS